MQDNTKQIRALICDAIRTIHPDKFNLNRKEFATLVGVTVGHISNCEVIYKRPLVLPVYEGSKVLYPMTDVIDYLVNQRLKTLKAKRGAPTKASRIDAKGGV